MLNRRDLLRFLGAGAAGTAAAGLGCAKTSSETPAPAATAAAEADSGPDFSVAFLNDPHVYGEKGAVEATMTAFDMAMAEKPDAVITGGDMVMDLLEVERDSADAQFDLLEQCLAKIDVPIYHAIGNHDCYGVSDKSSVTPDDPLWGKRYFLERLGLERSYTSFDHKGWHFAILDTIDLQGTGYRGYVGEEQLAWLDEDLAKANKPTVIATHIPIFSNYIEWRRGTAEGIPDAVSVVNCHEVAKVLEKHPVKLVVCGHLHVNEVFRYKGIEFANVGAISGNWWNGLRDGFEEGFTMLDFKGDQVRWRYIDYGWDAVVAEDGDAAHG